MSIRPLPIAFCPLLVGRETELGTLVQRWRADRLVTLYGQSGVGKSALARAAAARLCAAASGSVFAVDARDAVAPFSLLRPLFRAVRHVERQGDREDEAARAEPLALRGAERTAAFREPLFLLLDNLPTVSPELARSVGHWSEAHPHVHLLVATARPLNLASEQAIPLPPLGVPEESGLETASVELLRHFLGCSGIDLAAMEPELVPVLCRALDGLPAALEAAAALFGHLPAHEAARIVREEPLSLSLRGQTLRETFAGTWAALPDEARDFLAANAAWPASFPADLAACLWGRGPATHTTLFLRQIGLLHEAADTPGPRCRVSRLMRFWVRECLPPDPLRQERLARTLLAWVEERKFPRDGSANPEDLRLLGWAWRWLAGRREGEAVGRFARALVEPLRRVREGREEAHELLQSALAYTRTSPPASRARQIRTAAREAPRSSASHLPNILSHPSFPGLLRIRLLGRLEVEGAGDMLTARDLRPKEQRVLARLALGVGRVVPRDTLLELFWPERSFAAAERSLRTVVSSLRAALRPLRADAASGFIRGRMDGYCLEEAACTVDAVSFAAAINDARKAQAEDVPVRAEAAWRRAIALYRGDLLSEFPYEDWCLSERERLRDDLLDALFHVARVAMATSAWHEAREMAARMVAIDPAEERAHRLLMRCHALLGRPAEALRQYERCAAALWEELGAHAGSATVALCEALRAGALLELEEADEPAAHHGMAPGRAGQRVVTPLRSVR